MNKNLLWRIACLALTVSIFSTVVTACGDNKDNADLSSDTSSITKQEVVDDDKTVIANTASGEEGSIYDSEDWDPYASMPDSIKGQTVRFATWGYDAENEGAIVWANIEKDIGIKVETYYIQQGNYIKLIMDKMNSGDIPDVFMNNDTTAGFPLTLQIAQPINLCSDVDLKDPIWDQSMLKMGVIGGNNYLVNTVGSPHAGSNLIYYNKSIFDEYGFTTPEEYYAEGTWTWDNMLKCMKEVSQIGDDYIGGTIYDNYISASAGASFIKYDAATSTFSNGTSDNKLHEAYEFYLKAKEQGLTGGSPATFAQGKTGLIMTGVFGFKANGYFGEMNPNDIGYTYLPSIDEDSECLTSSIYRQYGICANAPNANAAGYFIRYYLDPINYDLDNTFISKKAGNFYYGLLRKPAEEKYFDFTDAVSSLVGEKTNYFYSVGMNSSSLNVATDIKSVSNEVDQAVSQANELVQRKISEFQ